jgi:hypothetical protein
MHLRTIIVVSTLVLAVMTPVATASPALDPGTRTVEDRIPAAAANASGFEDELALRSAFSGRGWQLDDRGQPVAVTRATPQGFDWSSAVVGAATLLAVMLLGLFVAPILRRKRTAAPA